MKGAKRKSGNRTLELGIALYLEFTMTILLDRLSLMHSTVNLIWFLNDCKLVTYLSEICCVHAQYSLYILVNQLSRLLYSKL